MDWFIWRVFTHERNKSPLIEIYECWTLMDVQDFHDVVDALGQAEEKQRRQSKAHP